MIRSLHSRVAFSLLRKTLTNAKMLLLTFMAIALFSTISFAQPAGWLFSFPVTIQENSGVTLTEYPVLLTMNTEELVTSGSMKADGSDIRFSLDEAGTMPLTHFILSGMNTPATQIYIRVDNIPANETKIIYIAFGNPSATSVENYSVFQDGPHSSTDSVASGSAGGAGNSQRGFRFSANEDIVITAFGKREPTGTTRYVTLFNFATQEIVKQTQVSGPAAQYSYQDLDEPIFINAGVQYTIQVFQAPGDGYYFGTSSQIGEHLTYYDMRYCNSCTQNTFPNSTLSNYHYGYPDFLYYVKKQASVEPTANVVFNKYRTAKYEDWAKATDLKGKLVSTKRKADKVAFKFTLTADSSRPLKMDFGMVVNAVVTRGTKTPDTLLVVTNGKKFLDTLGTVSMGEVITVEGIGKSGKKMKAKYSWGKKKAVTMKADSLYVTNTPGLPMPNLHNVGEELFPKGFNQSPAYFANGLLIGVPQGAKKGNSVLLAKYAEVSKSMVKKVKNGYILDTALIRCLDTLSKKPITKQLKNLPPDKMNNKLFAEALTLKLNIAASATEKFPAGLGEMTFNDGDTTMSASAFNGAMVSVISQYADSMLSCLNLTSRPTATLSDLYSVLRKINVAFADSPYTVDTLSFGAKTKFKGLKTISAVPYLAETPGIEPKIVFTPDVMEANEPVNFALYQNYPNPFNPTTNISFEVANTSVVTLKVYNMLGQVVATLLNRQEFESGDYEVPFIANELSSGVYFYRINVESVDEDGMQQSFTDVKRMVLLK